MKILITYSSKTGNTEKLARAVHGRLAGKAEIKPLPCELDPNDYDLVMAGFWLKGGTPEPQAAEFLPRVKGRDLFLFATHGAAPGSEHVASALAAAENLAPQANLVGAYACQGQVDPGFLEKLKAKESPPPWVKDADSAVGHPDQADLKGLIEAVNKVVGGEGPAH